jgi:hypothetical protein
MSSDVAKAVVRRNTEEVQGSGNFDALTPDKAGVRGYTPSMSLRSLESLATLPFSL